MNKQAAKNAAISCLVIVLICILLIGVVLLAVYISPWFFIIPIVSYLVTLGWVAYQVEKRILENEKHTKGR